MSKYGRLIKHLEAVERSIAAYDKVLADGGAGTMKHRMACDERHSAVQGLGLQFRAIRALLDEYTLLHVAASDALKELGGVPIGRAINETTIEMTPQEFKIFNAATSLRLAVERETGRSNSAYSTMRQLAQDTHDSGADIYYELAFAVPVEVYGDLLRDPLVKMSQMQLAPSLFCMGIHIDLGEVPQAVPPIPVFPMHGDTIIIDSIRSVLEMDIIKFDSGA